MLAAPDQQISLTDPDSRSMATSGRGSGVVGYNVQVAVDTKHHLIITHEVTNVGSDRAQLGRMAKQTKLTLEATSLDAIADRGYFSGEEILECDKAGITVTLPKPMTSNAKAEGRFGKQDFRYVADEDVYICPAGEKLAYHYTNEENELVLRRYWTNACHSCAIKHRCTMSMSILRKRRSSLNSCSRIGTSLEMRGRSILQRYGPSPRKETKARAGIKRTVGGELAISDLCEGPFNGAVEWIFCHLKNLSRRRSKENGPRFQGPQTR
jgi:hypothetical protein